MRPPARPLAVAVLLTLASGCDTPAGDAEGGQPRREQIGDRHVVTHESTQLAAVLLGAAAPRLRWTASSDALTVLGHALAAAELPDGRVAVLDDMGDQLHLLSPDGTLHATWGSRGEGPQQFLAATGMFVVRDSLIVVDHGGARASHVGADGTISRLLRTPPAAGVALLGRTTAGEWIGASTATRPAATDGTVDTLLATIVVLDRAGAVSDTIGEYVERLAVLRATPQMQTMVKLPYSPRGGARAAGAWVAFHSGTDFRVTLVDRGSTQRREIAVDSVPPALAPDRRARIVTAALGTVMAGQQRMMEQLWQRTPWPEREGAFIGAHPTASGGVWLGVVDEPDAVVGGPTGREFWLHMDGRGGLTNAFALAPREQLLAVSDASAVVLARDADDVQTIRVVALPPAARPTR